jgi:hypothetical protein
MNPVTNPNLVSSHTYHVTISLLFDPEDDVLRNVWIARTTPRYNPKDVTLHTAYLSGVYVEAGLELGIVANFK